MVVMRSGLPFPKQSKKRTLITKAPLKTLLPQREDAREGYFRLRELQMKTP